MKLLATILFIQAISFAQELDFEAVDELVDREQKIIETIVANELKNRKGLPKEAVVVQLSDILKSPTQTVHISKGAKLVNLFTGEQELLTKDIYAVAYTKPDSSGYFYLKNNSGDVPYKTLIKNLTDITLVTQMYEPPVHYKPILKDDKPKKYIDKDFDFTTELNLHLGTTNPGFTRDLVNDGHNGQLVGYELQAYDSFRLPFSVGASLLYETITATIGNGSENYNSKALIIGPLIKLRPFEVFEFPIVASAGVRTSLFSNIDEQRATESLKYNLSKTELFAGLQHNISINNVYVTLGINFKRQWIKASSTEFKTDLSFDNTYDDSLSFTIGHLARWP